MSKKRIPTPDEWQATSQEMVTLRLSRGQWYSISTGLILVAKEMAEKGADGGDGARYLLGFKRQIDALTGCLQLDAKPEDTKP